jgi:hypothetical protein
MPPLAETPARSLMSSDPSRTFLDWIALFLIFAVVTALFFRSAVPIWVAAYAPPPRATSTATEAVTFEYFR